MREPVECESETARHYLRLVRSHLPVKNSRICRKINFADDTSTSRHVGSDVSDDISRLMSDMNDSERRRARDKYEFDTNTGQPLPNAQRWSYSEGSVSDGTPEFYLRPPHKRPTRPSFRPIQSATSAYRTPVAQQAVSHCDTGEVSPSSIARELFPDSPKQQPTDTLAIDSNDTLFRPDTTQHTDASAESSGRKYADSINLPGNSSSGSSTPSSAAAGSRTPSHSEAGSSSESNTRKRERKQSLVTDYFSARKRARADGKSDVSE